MTTPASTEAGEAGTDKRLIADDVRALADRLVDYMTTRTSPWRDEAVMREAVHATCSLLFGDAFYETELLVRKRVGS